MNTYEQYLQTIQQGMLDANGRFKSPDAGVNFQAEGMTPQEFYSYINQQVGDPMARDGADGGPRARGNADAGWTPGVVDTKSGLLGNFGVPLAMLAAPFAASAMGFGSATAPGAAGSTAGGGALGAAGDFGAGTYGAGGAVAAPVTGGSLGITGTALPELGAAGSGSSAAAMIGGNADKAALLGGAGYGPAATAAEMAAYPVAAGGGGLLDTATGWLKENPTLARLGGAALGALSSKDQTQSSTQNRDPWGPAQPYLKDNLATNASMQDYYRANPFSQEQKRAYQGLLDTLANNQANGNVLLGNASRFGQSSRGALPAMQGLLTGTQSPSIDWSQFANIGRR